MITRQGYEIKGKGTTPLKGGVVLLSFALSPGIPVRCKKIKKVSLACPLLCPLLVLCSFTERGDLDGYAVFN